MLICAHVVATTLGISEDTPGIPTDEVRLDFPLIEPGCKLTARVVHWDTERDVAGLELSDAPPADAQPVRLVTADDLWGHAFRAFGFPVGYEDGVWTSGVLRGRIGSGWVQIEDVKEPGYWVQPGFSGTPVWDEQLDGVVGMAVAADTDRATKAAFMIPARVLIEAWPELAEQSLEAGSLEHLQMQLARLEEAQRQAVDPDRFQPQIETLRERIASWDHRVERQRARIAEGLEEQRQRMAEERARRREEDRLRVVGQPPLDVADYFKDRQRDLEKLGQLLSEPTTRLVSVIGHGGMGKTALACKVLQDLERHRWPYTEDELPVDGIVYLSTRTAGISLERLFLDCAKLLGGEEQERLNAMWTNPQIETEEKIARLLKALRDGRYVILLDNLEDLLDDRGQLTDDDLRLFFERALMSSQGAQLLVTSRVALAFRREVMRFDRQVKLLEGLPIEDGVALLRELDPNGDYGLRDASEEQLAEAVELTHGVPRALEVLAGILANDPFATLDEVMETFYEQEDVVQALIEENYRRLDRDARRVIEALAVFRKPVPPLAVDFLLEPFAPGLDVPSVVQRLKRTNIVSVDRAAKTVTLHPIDQDYAYSQLPEEDETEAAYTRQALERRAADYYVQLRTPEDTWESIDDLEPQLNEFEHRVRAGNYDDAYSLTEPISFNCLFQWGYYVKLAKLWERLLGHVEDPLLSSAHLGHLGIVYRVLGHYGTSMRITSQAFSLAETIGNNRWQSAWLGNLGIIYRDLGKTEKAMGLFNWTLDKPCIDPQFDL
jgi:tetratricopeptide (TPR) repeat protein